MCVRVAKYARHVVKVVCLSSVLREHSRHCSIRLTSLFDHVRYGEGIEDLPNKVIGIAPVKKGDSFNVVGLTLTSLLGVSAALGLATSSTEEEFVIDAEVQTLDSDKHGAK